MTGSNFFEAISKLRKIAAVFQEFRCVSLTVFTQWLLELPDIVSGSFCRVSWGFLEKSIICHCRLHRCIQQIEENIQSCQDQEKKKRIQKAQLFVPPLLSLPSSPLLSLVLFGLDVRTLQAMHTCCRLNRKLWVNVDVSIDCCWLRSLHTLGGETSPV